MNTDIRLEDTEVVVDGDLKLTGSDLQFDCPSRRSNAAGYRRALVHDFDDALTINFGSDYPGGVKLQGVVTAPGLLLAEPLRALVSALAGVETYLFLDGKFVPPGMDLTAGKRYQARVSVCHRGAQFALADLGVTASAQSSAIDLGGKPVLAFPGTLAPGQSTAPLSFEVLAKEAIPAAARPQLVQYQLAATLIPRVFVTQQWPQGDLPRPEIHAVAQVFGVVLAGQSQEAAVTVQNTGSQPLLLSTLTVVPTPGTEAGTFTLKAPFTQRTVAPGGKEAIVVVFAPKKPGHPQATLQIGSNDLISPVLAVALAGSCASGHLVASPESLDAAVALSDTTLGHVKFITIPFQVKNTAQGTVISATRITESPPAPTVGFSVLPAASASQPLPIAAGGSKQFSVRVSWTAQTPPGTAQATIYLDYEGDVLEVPISVSFDQSPV